MVFDGSCKIQSAQIYTSKHQQTVLYSFEVPIGGNLCPYTISECILYNTIPMYHDVSNKLTATRYKNWWFLERIIKTLSKFTWGPGGSFSPPFAAWFSNLSITTSAPTRGRRVSCETFISLSKSTSPSQTPRKTRRNPDTNESLSAVSSSALKRPLGRKTGHTHAHKQG